jgi:hypothetical protein
VAGSVYDPPIGGFHFALYTLGIGVSPSLPTGEQKGFGIDNIWLVSAL